MTPDLDTRELFAHAADTVERIGPQSVRLRGFALPTMREILAALDEVLRVSPLRNMVTPGGAVMSVAMTNCGALGWTSDRRGYRYAAVDPRTGRPWAAMPASFVSLASAAACRAGFEGFAPDACLVNRYVPGARLSLHQDRDEHDYTQPIVSVSLGLGAVFLFGGHGRTGPTLKVPLAWRGPVALPRCPAASRRQPCGAGDAKDQSHVQEGSLRHAQVGR
jgi:alkylated DNA repair protein (DNA oxidative demethylase)